MFRLKPVFRTGVVAVGLTLAAAGVAAAAEATVTTETTTETTETAEKPFKMTIYVGPGFGVAFQDVTIDNGPPRVTDSNTEFGWAMQVLARPFEWLGLQIEYFNLGGEPGGSGEFDGVYFGVAPMLPLPGGVDLYGQVGAAISDAGDDVAGGGGLMYTVPIEWLEKIHVDLALRADYKYYNLDEGQHELLFGVMFGLSK